MLIKLGIVTSLFVLFYQDMRYRAVYWVLFPVLLLLYLALTFQHFGFDAFLVSSSSNIIFLLSQFFMLTLYFSLKQRRWVNITAKYLGWGDILFLLTLGFYLSPLNYLMFYVLSLIVVLLVTLLLAKVTGRVSLQIPLAGLQSVMFAFLFVADWSSKVMNLQSDDWIIYYFL